MMGEHLGDGCGGPVRPLPPEKRPQLVFVVVLRSTWRCLLLLPRLFKLWFTGSAEIVLEKTMPEESDFDVRPTRSIPCE